MRDSPPSTFCHLPPQELAARDSYRLVDVGPLSHFNMICADEVQRVVTEELASAALAAAHHLNAFG